jgi:2-iminobutanoate/2-iminopropanoate deaminase
MERRITYINEVLNAPKALGPYSQATVIENMVCLSGQVGLDPETMQLVGPGVEEQAEQVLKNLKAVLDYLRLDFWDVMKTTIFLTDIGDFKTVNEIYSRHLGEAKPARSTFAVAALPLGAKVEIEMTAWKRR